MTTSILVKALINTEQTIQLNSQEWALLTAQARAAKLLGRLYYLLHHNHHDIHIPKPLLWHYISAYKVAERQRRDSIREAHEISQVLATKNISPIFIKGSAYALKSLPVTYGRLMSDIDVLILKKELFTAESTLFACGWLKSKLDDYDEMYYRKWMHEIPPLKHISRQTVLDLHHNILPLTNKDAFDANILSKEIIKQPEVKNSYTLSEVDMVIHSAVHLFTESEFHNGLRDLSDLDILIRHFSEKNPNFVNLLVNQANKLGLANYLWLCLRYTHLVFNTPIQKSSIEQLKVTKKIPGYIDFIDFSFINIFKPDHASCRDWRMKLAKIILYWRGHLIRMPLKLLIPHLIKKAYMQINKRMKKNDNSLNKLN